MAEISEKTTIKLTLPVAFLLIGGVLSVGGVYFTSQLTAEVAKHNEINIEKDRELNRLEREKIRDEEAEKHLEMYKWFKEYMNDEIGGLRSDWERRYRDNINPRLKDLEND